MSHTMVTLDTRVQVSQERLDEIFDVPKTKAIFDELMAKKENVEVIKALEEIFQETLELLKMQKDTTEEVDKLLAEKQEILVNKVKGHVLLEALQLVVDGRSLNQAVQLTIRQQIKKSTVFEKVAIDIQANAIRILLMNKMS